MYQLKFKKKAVKQLLLIAKNEKLKDRLQLILDDISANPYSPQFKFERLKSNLRGLCSKRLTDSDRIVYRVSDTEIEVLVITVLGHYDD